MDREYGVTRLLDPEGQCFFTFLVTYLVSYLVTYFSSLITLLRTSIILRQQTDRFFVRTPEPASLFVS